MGTTLRRGSSKHLADYSTKAPAALSQAAPVINVQEFHGQPISGGTDDSQRSRIIKAFYERLPDERIIYIDITGEQPHVTALGQKQIIFNRVIPEARTFVLDSVKFFARTAVGQALIPAGTVEGALQCFFTIGSVGQARLNTTRVQAGAALAERAYFPFLTRGSVRSRRSSPGTRRQARVSRPTT
jgi:hypothetical protein